MVNEIERARATQALLNAARDYALRFEGCPERRMSKELRALHKARQDYDEAFGIEVAA